MDIQKSLEVLEKIKEDAESLQYEKGVGYNKNALAVISRLEMVIKKIFSDNKYVHQIKSITFKPPGSDSFMIKEPGHIKWFYEAKKELINTIKIIMEDITLTEFSSDSAEGLNKANIQKDNIFIVHGHNNEIKESVARAIEKLGFNPVILHEMPNQGKTIIEKFTEHSNVGFAIILLSADDFGYSKRAGKKEKKLRARQNVILEMGFFLGKLGRDRVLILIENSDNFEIPSDYDGVLYTPFDKAGAWKNELVRELKSAKYDVDANDLL